MKIVNRSPCARSSGELAVHNVIGIQVAATSSLLLGLRNTARLPSELPPSGRVQHLHARAETLRLPRVQLQERRQVKPLRRRRHALLVRHRLPMGVHRCAGRNGVQTLSRMTLADLMQVPSAWQMSWSACIPARLNGEGS